MLLRLAIALVPGGAPLEFFKETIVRIKAYKKRSLNNGRLVRLFAL
ncbi:MAG: hypothetical protein AAF215_24030 [Cyanobacteria bacterium P01_A01_bin.123]